MIRCAMLVFCALSTSSISAAPPAPSVAPAPARQIDNSTQTQDVRFKTEDFDRMTVPVTVSGAGPFRFLVDTGADRTAISAELAARLKLSSGPDARVHSIAGVSTVSTAEVPDLQLTRKATRVIDAPLLAAANIGADGILGTDSLRSDRVEFDFAGQTMAIVPSSRPQVQEEPGAIVVRGYRRNGRLVVADATVNGRPLTVVIDTGSQICIGNLALRRELLGKNLIDPARKVDLQSVTGQTLSGDYMFVRELDVGGIGLKNLAIVFADAHTFKQLGLDRKPALLLGMNAMRAFKKVSIDFANLNFRVVLPEEGALTEVAEARAD
ncbi:MAG TPA: retroviral-like aspartic protease family protein [Sphingomicrobium sp.]|nr:retroviral-like aspartic protease family protein [Sphingomicrobium sp.]